MGTTHCVNLDPHLILRLPQKDIMLKYAREEFQQDLHLSKGGSSKSTQDSRTVYDQQISPLRIMDQRRLRVSSLPHLRGDPGPLKST